MSKVKYAGNKDTATNAAVDHVAYMRLVKIRAAEHEEIGLCCLTLDFGDKSQVPEADKYPKGNDQIFDEYSLDLTAELQFPLHKDIASLTFARREIKKGYLDNEYVKLTGIEVKDAQQNSLGRMEA